MGFLQRSYERIELLHKMMDRTDTRLDSDLSLCGESNIKSALVSCLACKNVDECKLWLNEVEGAVRPPDFCANVHRLKGARDN